MLNGNEKSFTTIKSVVVKIPISPIINKNITDIILIGLSLKMGISATSASTVKIYAGEWDFMGEKGS